jgi:hypothetical protein
MAPLRFCFGLHLHQPVGNFDHVFEQHVRDVYRPFLERIGGRAFVPVALHISGPLLEWLEAHDHGFLDLLGALASDGKLELLLAGFYEPVLASLARQDRIEQIAWLRETLQSRLGAASDGLWLTERVWEPDLAADLHDAGVRFALVDDRHFVVTGFRRDQLHAPYWTEHGGKRVALFPIDERLRYLIPFRHAEESAAYLRTLRHAGHQLAVLADDGEKFGGWPGTHEWVYQQGWLDRFLDVMDECIGAGDVMMSTFGDALDAVPSGGIAYLPTASYREMEAWSLPTPAAERLTALEAQLGAERIAGPDGALVRGAHWKNFFVKYPESNRMHKKMLALSSLCRDRGDPPVARRAIGRAQCNDAYWHGVFGGLYLPFLRSAIWSNLAIAEQTLRNGETLTCEELDIDGDGHRELWVHSSHFSAIVSPFRGGVIEELTKFDAGENLANTLTRRREAYHVAALSEYGHDPHGDQTGDAAPSIHDIERGLQLRELPVADVVDRAIFQERVLAGAVTHDEFARAAYRATTDWTQAPLTHEVNVTADGVSIALVSPDRRLRKKLTFRAEGSVHVVFEWDSAAFTGDEWFTTELSLARSHEVRGSPGCEQWQFPIETVSKSERGFDRTLQGVSYVVRWPARQGRGEVELPNERSVPPPQ